MTNNSTESFQDLMGKMQRIESISELDSEYLSIINSTEYDIMYDDFIKQHKEFEFPEYGFASSVFPMDIYGTINISKSNKEFKKSLYYTKLIKQYR